MQSKKLNFSVDFIEIICYNQLHELNFVHVCVELF